MVPNVFQVKVQTEGQTDSQQDYQIHQLPIATKGKTYLCEPKAILLMIWNSKPLSRPPGNYYNALSSHK